MSSVATSSMPQSDTRKDDRHVGVALAFRVSDEMRDALRERARLEERSMTVVLQRALRLYMETPVTK